jgi:hypothetical protein
MSSPGDRVPGRIVLDGATGYIGGLTARAMVAMGSRPVLAGRHQGRLTALADKGTPDRRGSVLVRCACFPGFGAVYKIYSRDNGGEAAVVEHPFAVGLITDRTGTAERRLRPNI